MSWLVPGALLQLFLLLAVETVCKVPRRRHMILDGTRLRCALVLNQFGLLLEGLETALALEFRQEMNPFKMLPGKVLLAPRYPEVHGNQSILDSVNIIPPWTRASLRIFEPLRIMLVVRAGIFQCPLVVRCCLGALVVPISPAIVVVFGLIPITVVPLYLSFLSNGLTLGRVSHFTT